MKWAYLMQAIIIVGHLHVSVGTEANVSAAEQSGKSIRLFNGTDLSGWSPFLWDRFAGERDRTTPSDKLWMVENGVLICAGRPTGYLQTNALYSDYKLALEWRWPKDTTSGNSGVLVHVSTPQTLGQWPKSVEVQLYTRNAGDFWVIGTTMKVPNADTRVRGRRHLNLTDDSEKPIGQWNQMEITCLGARIDVHVNGDLVNHATRCSERRGAIALQSEGREIHFRNITLTPLDK